MSILGELADILGLLLYIDIHYMYTTCIVHLIVQETTTTTTTTTTNNASATSTFRRQSFDL